jgi:hypothetical protein
MRVKLVTHMNNETQLLYLHRYLIGGATTFTAHLMYTLAKFRTNNIVLRVGNRTEKKLRDFGYGLSYMNISNTSLVNVRCAIVVIFKERYIHVLDTLNKNIQLIYPVVMIIHDHRDISEKAIPFIRNYKLVTMRRMVQKYLKEKYDLDSTFIHHPFYPYPVVIKNARYGAVSISRISFEKNIDIIINANRFLESHQFIRIYGCPSRIYVYRTLGGERGEFGKYYFGKFEKSFSTLTNILSGVKFVVDLSVLKHDGGGTQYTFLEAIHNGCALILHRKWLENRELDASYSDFKEGYNCYAVESAEELAELVRRNEDTSKVTQNATKLMTRHIDAPWSQFVSQCDQNCRI